MKSNRDSPGTQAGARIMLDRTPTSHRCSSCFATIDSDVDVQELLDLHVVGVQVLEEPT